MEMLKTYRKISGFFKDMKKENISTYASSGAFFIFLSLVPILIVICTVIPYTPLTKESVLSLILEIFPAKVYNSFGILCCQLQNLS